MGVGALVTIGHVTGERTIVVSRLSAVRSTPHCAFLPTKVAVKFQIITGLNLHAYFPFGFATLSVLLSPSIHLLSTSFHLSGEGDSLPIPTLLHCERERKVFCHSDVFNSQQGG